MTTRESLDFTLNGERLTVSPTTLEKYNQPGPRYTSYPTAPEWDDQFDEAAWRKALDEANGKPQPAPLSLYFHIPFCESLCLYCGCNVVISKKHEVAHPYLDALKRETDWLSAAVLPSRKVEQLHWGGGTPTYLTPAQIEDLYGHIQKRFSFSESAEISV
ncbi:MAG: coproporphyrinogen III oxidase, partial [Blastocatellia bacterium]